MKVNVKINKRCAFCKYWYDPSDSCISPTNAKNYWEFDPNVKQKCLKLNSLKSASVYCSKYECKVPIV